MPSSYSLDYDIIVPIYKEYLLGFEQCNKYCNPNLNLMGIIFHEIMYVTSCYVYGKYWANNKIAIDFPFLGFRQNKFSHKNRFIDYTLKRQLAANISTFYSKNDLTLAILNPSIDLNKLLKLLLKSRINFTFPKSCSFDIPNYDNQIQIIKSKMNFIWREYGLKGNTDFFINAIHTSYKKLSNEKSINNYDILLIGSPVKIPVRCEAAKALAEKKPVICVDHGNETGTADHPTWGYDEQSYCSHFVGYGEEGKVSINNGKYTKPLHGGSPIYIESNSNLFVNKNISSQIPEIDFTNHNYKKAYVPTKLMGNNRLGPFLSISDKQYIKWQKYIFSQIRDLDYKVHPKEINHSLPGNINIVYDSLENCMDQYNYFIIDNVLSTAFANIAATNKPIVYFNIGFGNLSENAKKNIEERVIWIDVKIDNPINIFDAMKENNKSCKNNYTNKYSISSNNDITREQTILNTVENLIT